VSDWILVPCLVGLRTEFNIVAPGRRKGADGAIGDGAHTSSSDHTPDEDSNVLRGRDADSKNEVHALDIDSAGPWPGGPAWFDAAIKGIVARHKDGRDDRLQYVIWNRKIANRDIDNWRWRTYTGTADPHTNHAHFSARYTTAQESDTSPWGLLGGDDDMALDSDMITLTADTAKEIGRKAGDKLAAATLLQLAVIFAARGDDKASAANDRYVTVDARLSVIEKWVNSLSDPNTPAAQVAAALRAALGDRAKAVGQILAGS